MRRFVFGTVASFGLAAVVWEAFARSGLFSPALSPSLAVIVPALVQMVVSGSIFVHIAYTLYRILWGLGLAALLGVPVGILMGRFKAAERFVLPGSLPFVIAGLRQAFARSWIAVVGGEMIAATSWGLGWVIFDSKEFLRTDVMLSTLVVIGILGLGFERLVFQVVERRTVGRWGMVRTAGT